MRSLLIQVAIDLVRREGLAALTARRIGCEAGIGRSGLYTHFKNVDDLLRSAITHVVIDMQRKSRPVRDRAARRFRDSKLQDRLAAIHSACKELLDLTLSERIFTEFLLRYRRDSSSLLGRSMQKVVERMRANLTADLWQDMRALGAKDEHQVHVVIWADQILALYFAAAEALLDGRHEHKELVTDSFALSGFAIMQANMQRILPAAKSLEDDNPGRYVPSFQRRSC